MKKEPKYEILKSLPPYGPMYVTVSDDGMESYSEGYVVKFFKSDSTEWIANFKTGWSDFNCVHSFENTDLIVVISSGTCYLMHPDEIKPRNVFGVGYKSLLEKENGGLILEDQTNLTIIEENGEIWHSERISFDGFKDIKLKENIVSGFYYVPTSGDGQWTEFSLNLLTKELLSGSSYIFNGNETKPWWKIW
ncbi:hypothetical protein [Cellulophaga sp. L1A9]|uniref:hypothetical protein n=1 Tax=Cellulophaga sp. L1A9 TaxID=2686362 RepID=UPI00131C2C54|nr:hypothetical protein [Cellulophaga sp. L1A9]